MNDNKSRVGSLQFDERSAHLQPGKSHAFPNLRFLSSRAFSPCSDPAQTPHSLVQHSPTEEGRCSLRKDKDCP